MNEKILQLIVDDMEYIQAKCFAILDDTYKGKKKKQIDEMI